MPANLNGVPSAAERRAWRPTETLTVSRWAERHRTLTRMQSARPGPWRNRNAPYLAYIMDAALSGEVEELTIMKAAQVGVSEALRNVIGALAAQEPDPVLLVLPDEQTGRKIIAQRIVPLLRDTKCLAELVTPTSRDVQLRFITLANGFTLRLGWSGSPASLASDPCRVVINDEVDKFAAFSAREADPISLGYARTQTFGNRRLVVNASTPTTAIGLIARRHEQMPRKLAYHVPCPRCGDYQVLIFWNIKWTDGSTPEQIEAEPNRVWYECSQCHGRILERERVAMIRAGEWRDAPGSQPQARRIGLHIWAAYAIWIPLWRIAAEFLRSKDDRLRLMAFYNGWLGEPFHEQIARVQPAALAEKSAAATQPPRCVPSWARVLVATADTQKDHFYYVVRAWAEGFRSQRIDHGIAQSFDELRDRTLAVRYPHDGASDLLGVTMLGIDSGGTGDRTHQVYRFAQTDPQRIRAMKGDHVRRDVPLRTRRITYRPPERSAAPLELHLTLVNANYYKDRLAYALTAKLTTADGEVDLWTLDNEQDADYCQQMSSEHKVPKRTAGGGLIETWLPVSAGAANHYWDCEYGQLAVADMLRLDLLRAPLPTPPRPPLRPVQPANSSTPGRMRPVRRNYG